MTMIARPDSIGTQGFQFIKAALRIGAQTWVAIEAACAPRNSVTLASRQQNHSLRV